MNRPVSKQQLWQLGLVAFILAQVWFAARGLEVAFGSSAPAIVLFALIFRFGLAFVIGAFLYAYLLLDWPWPLATLFSAPSVILMLPRMMPDIATAFDWWRRKVRSWTEG